MIRIRTVTAPDRAGMSALTGLLEGYAVHLLDTLGSAHVCLRDFEAERLSLFERYCVLLLATIDEIPAGCALLKPLPERSACEMKRLWVEPFARGCGVGRQLIQQLIREAENAGFGAMYLDTVTAGMQAAVRLYLDFGFTSVPRYNDNRVPGVEFFRLSITRPDGQTR